MSYVLGSTTLPRPNSFERRYIEKSATVVTLNNTTKKDITGRKEQFILGFRMLTQAQVNSILSEYELNVQRNFSVAETNLTISATPVHIECDRRQYATAGPDYREDLTLILTEVQ